jgi:fluoroquinolone transport system ATP-binding protein
VSTSRPSVTLKIRDWGKARDRKIGSFLRMVGLDDAADMPVGQYSKGMKTRLSVARALAHRPELLFLNEPTAGLDPMNSRNIRDLIREQQAAGRTVFLTTHDRDSR